MKILIIIIIVITYYHIHCHHFNRKTSTVGHNLLEPPTLNKSSCHLIGGHPTLHSLSRKEMTVHRGLHSRTIRPQRPFILSMLNGPPLDISTTWMMYCDKGTPVKSVIIYYRFINFSASGKHSECRWSRMASYSNPPFVIRQTCMNFN